MSANVTITKRLYDLWLAEANRIHDLCDAAEIPRDCGAGEFSLSQRVEILAGVCAGLVKRATEPGVH